jgi:hypothetical protein
MGGFGAVIGTKPSFLPGCEPCVSRPLVGDGLCVPAGGSNGFSVIGWSGSGEG